MHRIAIEIFWNLFMIFLLIYWGIKFVNADTMQEIVKYGFYIIIFFLSHIFREITTMKG